MEYPTVFDQLLRASALLDRDLANTLAPVGLSASRMHVLWVVHHAGPQTQQQLATALEVTPRNITGLVDGLVESGHVTREPHPTDRRAVLVRLTPTATVFLEKSAQGHAQVAEELLGAIPRDERASFERRLAAVVDKLEQLVMNEESPG